jgi:hypothetical protein
VLVANTGLTLFPGVGLFAGQPEGGLAFAGSRAMPVPPTGIVLADLDLDGVSDLVTACPTGQGQSQFVTLLNTTGPWNTLPFSLPGSAGYCKLTGEGTLQPGSPLSFRIAGGTPGAPVDFVASLTQLGVPFKGGLLVPFPTLVYALGPLDAQGALQLDSIWPTGIAPGTTAYMQAWIVDSGGPVGFSSTNGLSGTAP